jgi:hypothetical protein
MKNNSEIFYGYEYKGFVYEPETDNDGDVIKIFHDVKTSPEYRKKNEGFGKLVTYINMDWSPYRTPTEEQFKLWVDLGCPRRISTGPLTEKDLKEIKTSQNETLL